MTKLVIQNDTADGLIFQETDDTVFYAVPDAIYQLMIVGEKVDKTDLIEFCGMCPNNDPCALDLCSPDPSIALTVTGAAGIVNWCGETWTLPADSGVRKCVCPTTYMQVSNYVSAGFYKSYHMWSYSATPSTNLLISRYAYSTGFMIGAAFANMAEAFNRNLWDLRAGPPTGWPVNTQNVPVSFTAIDAVAQPSPSDYILGDEFFFEQALSGITYTVERGVATEWP